MSPKSHSTDVCTALIEELNSCIRGVITACVYGACKWTRKGYAGFP